MVSKYGYRYGKKLANGIMSGGLVHKIKNNVIRYDTAVALIEEILFICKYDVKILANNCIIYHHHQGDGYY